MVVTPKAGTRRPIVVASFALATALFASLSWSQGAVGGEPVAIIEEIRAPNASVRFMDYVGRGQVIDLSSNGRLILGYLHTCLRESITGGRVIVGREQSTVHGGKVVRERVECDGGSLMLTAKQAGKSGVLVLRGPPSTGGAIYADFNVYSTSPVLKLTTGAKHVRITRLDRPSVELTFKVPGRFIDLAVAGHRLKPGGIYRAVAGDRSVVFGVDASAKYSSGPILGRLVPL